MPHHTCTWRRRAPGRSNPSEIGSRNSRITNCFPVVYARSDDYSGEHLTNPTVHPAFTKLDTRPVCLCRHAIVGAGSVLLAGTVLREGVAIGSMSLVKGDTEPFTVYAGNPLRKIKLRSRRLLELEREMTQR